MAPSDAWTTDPDQAPRSFILFQYMLSAFIRPRRFGARCLRRTGLYRLSIMETVQLDVIKSGQLRASRLGSWNPTYIAAAVVALCFGPQRSLVLGANLDDRFRCEKIDIACFRCVSSSDDRHLSVISRHPVFDARRSILSITLDRDDLARRPEPSSP